MLDRSLPYLWSCLLVTSAMGCGQSSPARNTLPPAFDASSTKDAAEAHDGASPRRVDAGPTLRDGGQPALDAAHPVLEGGALPDRSAPCQTRISYGNGWIRPANHPASYDDVSALVTWDGPCTSDGESSYALLSNGWKPIFTGTDGCVVALDVSGSCEPQAGCTTRVTYGPGWIPPASHPAGYDDVLGRVFGDGTCHADGSEAYTALSNGWQPHFQGTGSCGVSLEYTQCGGLYDNPVVPTSCPDPGVLYDSGQYVLACTSGDAANAYPLYTSPDLATWTAHGFVFPAGHWPSWAVSDFWAPEVHKVGAHYVVYFSARSTAGHYSIGAASSNSPLGPFTDIGQPLIAEASMGLIDASEINAADGTPYVVWKEDGNAVGLPTPIHSQALSSDGLSLQGSAATLITNDEAWEGAVTEAPFMVQHAGTYYLFYSGNSYATTAYAVGVAEASSPLGPFTKLGSPVLATGGAWAGPGHCSVVDTPAGDTYMVYAAWESGCVGGNGCNRVALTDAVVWNRWPGVPFAPSSASRPLP